jgi:hypothetical protein
MVLHLLIQVQLLLIVNKVIIKPLQHALPVLLEQLQLHQIPHLFALHVPPVLTAQLLLQLGPQPMLPLFHAKLVSTA